MLVVLGARPRCGFPSPATDSPADADVTFSVNHGPVLGHGDAPVTIVEYTDLECPFCHRFHVTAFPQIKKKYIDTGKVRFVSRDLPLDFHPNAKNAALAARCGGEQGKFWALRDVLASHPDKLAKADVLGYAGQLGLDLARFKACLAGNRFEAALQKDRAEAIAAGVTATPTFVIGRTASGAMKGLRIVGAASFSTFDEKIGALLRPAPPTAR
jgi:protein-disulfide isomerase